MNNCYCSTGHVASETDIEDLERRLLYNYPIISKFNYIVVYQNFNSDSEQYIEKFNSIWSNVFGMDVIILPSKISRGHTFGTADSDNFVVDYAKKLPVDFIYKSSNDILLDNQILNFVPTHEFDFYYLQGIGYTGLQPFNFDIDEYLKNYTDPTYLYPKSNFYIITKNVDVINDPGLIDYGYNYCRNQPNYSGRPWEYLPQYSCEDFLKNCVIRNKLRYKHMLPDGTFKNLLNLVKDCKICDPSHKNIYFNEIGVCHFQWPDKPAIVM